MSIPTQQLDVWANQGAITTSSNTYTSIKTALEHRDSPISAMISSGLIKIDLQGSYAHDTNIYGDSDVDVIVKYTETFHSNKRVLPQDQLQIHDGHYGTATYDWDNLRRDVITALTKYYTTGKVDLSGKKSLKVSAVPGRLRLDVVPVISYRAYNYFYGPESDMHSREDGVCFKNIVTGEWIINYPDQHYRNAVDKHADTNNRYKSQVRIFKNMRNYLIDKGFLEKGEAPSYFIQGMVYNAPKHLFVADRVTTTLGILRWLRSIDLNTLQSQNEQHKLLGNTSDCWNPEHAKKTVEQLCFLWDKWAII